MRNGVTNALVTHRGVTGVTVPRPDPTRPDPITRAEVSIHDLRLLAGDKRMAADAASSRGVR